MQKAQGFSLIESTIIMIILCIFLIMAQNSFRHLQKKHQKKNPLCLERQRRLLLLKLNLLLLKLLKVKK
jgi:Tfp pilus assembly protein PilE